MYGVRNCVQFLCLLFTFWLEEKCLSTKHYHIVHACGMCGSKLNYERRKPELTQLFQIIAEHWETFKAEREMEGRTMPKYVAEEFESFLRCGILAYGFGRVYCEACEHEKLVAFSCKGRGFCPSCAQRKSPWGTVQDAWPRLRFISPTNSECSDNVDSSPRRLAAASSGKQTSPHEARA